MEQGLRRPSYLTAEKNLQRSNQQPLGVGDCGAWAGPNAQAPGASTSAKGEMLN